MSNDSQINEVRQWLESVVIGLNLCPFAKRELLQNRVRFVVTKAADEETLILALADELQHLEQEPATETTLLIHPQVLSSFEHYNQFIEHAEQLLRDLQFEGIYQIAGFHPQYQFAGTSVSDVENYTNRSPYPLLHLLREDSLETAIANHPDIESIPTRNIELMKRMGESAVRSLYSPCSK